MAQEAQDNFFIRNVKQSLKEFFSIGETYIKKMRDLQATLPSIASLSKLSEAERETLTRYLGNVNEVIRLYEELNFSEVDDAFKKPTQVVQELENGIHSESYENYMNLVGKLIPDQQKINEIYMRHQNHIQKPVKDKLGLQGIQSYTILPVQYIPRYELHWHAIVKLLKGEHDLHPDNEELTRAATSASRSYQQTKRYTEEMNKNKQELECVELAHKQLIGAGKNKDSTLIKLILELNINTPLQNKVRLEVAHFRKYLIALLKEAYPSLETPETILQNGELDQLILKKDGHELLWLALKSTLPIDETFSVQDRVSLYGKLAEALMPKKYLEAFNLAKAAYAIAGTDTVALKVAKKAFGPESTVGEWIINKHPTNQRKHVTAILSNKSPSAEVAEADHKETNNTPELLRRILDYRLNTVAAAIENREKAKTIEHDISSYLKTILANAYLTMFFLTEDGLLQVKQHQDTDKYAAIWKALGVDIYEPSPKSVVAIGDPKHFNTQVLDELYKMDQNPLWLVLKSTVPIGDTFTPQQKIEAYQQLAEAFKNKQIGEKDQYVCAFHLAQAAFEVAEAYKCQDSAIKSFGKRSNLGQWIIKGYDRLIPEEVMTTLSIGDTTEAMNEDLIHKENLPYKYATTKVGRNHRYIAGTDEFPDLKNKYPNLQGDALKTRILVDFKTELGKAANVGELLQIAQELRESDAFKILAKGQGYTSRLFKFETNSVAAFNKIVEAALSNIPSVDGLNNV